MTMNADEVKRLDALEWSELAKELEETQLELDKVQEALDYWMTQVRRYVRGDPEAESALQRADECHDAMDEHQQKFAYIERKMDDE